MDEFQLLSVFLVVTHAHTFIVYSFSVVSTVVLVFA